MGYIETKNSTKDNMTIGGAPVSVVVAPRSASAKREGLLRVFLNTVKSLLTGMKVTIGYLVRPSTVVTKQYPENRDTLKMFDRFRGQLQLVKDEDGYMNCNGCNFCELACPNGTIVIHDRRNPVNEKLELERFLWRLDSCTFCNACVQACPHDALQWSEDFEAAVYDRRLLVYTLNDYAGPPVKAINRAKKKDDRVEELLATIEPRRQFGGEVPLAGHELPGVPALQTEKPKLSEKTTNTEQPTKTDPTSDNI